MRPEAGSNANEFTSVQKKLLKESNERDNDNTYCRREERALKTKCMQMKAIWNLTYIIVGENLQASPFEF